MNEQLFETYRIMSDAASAYNPSTIVLCYSGGYDSMVMSHIAWRWAEQNAIGANVVLCAVDTLLSADGWRDYILSSAEEIGSKCTEIWDNPDLDHWRNDVQTRGFVYRRAQHHIYFYYLKQRVFRMIQANYKTSLHDRVMFFNGIRRSESKERLRSPEVEKRGAGVFVNPILYWQDDEIMAYRVQHALPINPFYDRFGNSGDCLCNWHIRIKLAQVERYSPSLLNVLIPLDVQNRAQFGYGYGEEPRKEAPKGQLPLFDWDTECTPNLCAGCSRPEPTNELSDFIYLQRAEW